MRHPETKSMAKNKMVQKHEEENDVDFFDDMESHGDEAMAGMLAGMVEASHNQQTTAIELTKLVIASNGSEKLSTKEVFAIFMQASQVANESTALKALWERFN